MRLEAVDELRAAVRWHGDPPMPLARSTDAAATAVRLRFVLRGGARLFSFHFAGCTGDADVRAPSLRPAGAALISDEGSEGGRRAGGDGRGSGGRRVLMCASAQAQHGKCCGDGRNRHPNANGPDPTHRLVPCIHA